MALDPTARESNVLDSIKKYFYDNLKTTENLKIFFNRIFAAPVNITDVKEDKFVSIGLHNIDLGNLASAVLKIHLFAKKDYEGFKLTQLRDTVMGYLIDESTTDGLGRIDLYKSDPIVPWTLLGGMTVQVVFESEHETLSDGTKLKYIIANLKWGSV